jgi:hypothetical protein
MPWRAEYTGGSQHNARPAPLQAVS